MLVLGRHRALVLDEGRVVGYDPVRDEFVQLGVAQDGRGGDQ